MTDPIIGITTYSGVNVLGTAPENTKMIPDVYIQAVRRAGGRPVLLPAGGSGQEAQEAVSDYVDGLLLPGGPYLNPALYGQKPSPETGEPDDERDGWEHAMLMQAVNSQVPVLGICRGMQLINVAFGGTLYQHIGDGGLHAGNVPGWGRHLVMIAEDSMLGEITDFDEFDPPLVTTRHHQAVQLVGDGLVVTATAEDDCPEAVEEPSHPFLLGVQWHPERDDDQSVFTGLVEAARKVMG